MLEVIRAQATQTEKDGKQLDPSLLELVANVERALSYCHSGIGRCLSRTTMDPLWLSKGLLVDGMPTLAPHVVVIALSHSSAPKIHVNLDFWPMDRNTLVPHSAAKASLIFYYNRAVANVSS